MPIPPFNEHGFLPAGEHEAAWAEVVERFGTGVKRNFLIEKLHSAVDRLIKLKVEVIYIDGSFVTSKARPGDVDVIYIALAGVDTKTWGDFSFDRHESLKRSEFIDLWPFPSPQEVAPGRYISIKDFFCWKDGHEKGIILLNLEGFS